MQPTDEEVFQRGREARALLENEAVISAFARLSDRITADWRRTATTASNLQVQLHAQVAAIDGVLGMLARDVEDADYLKAQHEKQALRAKDTPRPWRR